MLRGIVYTGSPMLCVMHSMHKCIVYHIEMNQEGLMAVCPLEEKILKREQPADSEWWL